MNALLFYNEHISLANVALTISIFFIHIAIVVKFAIEAKRHGKYLLKSSLLLFCLIVHSTEERTFYIAENTVQQPDGKRHPLPIKKKSISSFYRPNAKMAAKLILFCLCANKTN